MVMLCSYLRPGEALRLRRCDFVRPVPPHVPYWTLLVSPAEGYTPTKTGIYDAAVTMDTKWLPWMPQVLRALAQGPRDQTPWPFSYGELAIAFAKVVADAELPKLVPYQARHSGASIDRAGRHRTLEQIQKRGFWRSARSVARYERAARLASDYLRIPERVRLHCEDCEAALEATILGRHRAG